jgi:ABC-type transport system substrate-binding protein
LAADPAEIDLALLEIIRINILDIDLDVQFELYNRKILFERLNNKYCDMYITFYNALHDALPNFKWFTNGQYYNLSKYNSKKYENILDQIVNEDNYNNKMELIIEAQKILIDDVWGIWLAQGKNCIIYNSNINIGKPWPDGFLTPWTITKNN